MFHSDKTIEGNQFYIAPHLKCLLVTKRIAGLIVDVDNDNQLLERQSHVAVFQC